MNAKDHPSPELALLPIGAYNPASFRNVHTNPADATRAHLGALRSAHMGVMQINPADSTETSSEGNNDTSAIDKDVIAVVTSNFQLE